MPFDPREIESKEFLVALRGYDREEVRAFLEEIAVDYRELVEAMRRPPPTLDDPYEVLGVELGQVLRVARDSGDQLRRKAEEEATAITERAEEQAKTIRDAATKAATQLKEEADRYASATRSEADSDADESTRRARVTVDHLQEIEAALRERLRSIEMLIEAAKGDLGPLDDPQAATTGVAPPAPGLSVENGARVPGTHDTFAGNRADGDPLVVRGDPPEGPVSLDEPTPAEREETVESIFSEAPRADDEGEERPQRRSRFI